MNSNVHFDFANESEWRSVARSPFISMMTSQYARHMIGVSEANQIWRKFWGVQGWWLGCAFGVMNKYKVLNNQYTDCSKIFSRYIPYQEWKVTANKKKTTTVFSPHLAFLIDVALVLTVSASFWIFLNFFLNYEYKFSQYDSLDRQRGVSTNL